MDIGTSGVSSLPDRFVSKQGFVALAEDFPGTTTDPAQIVVSNASGGGVEVALVGLRTTLAADPRFGEGTIERSADGEVAVLSVPVVGDATTSEAIAAVRELRTELVPAALEGTDAEALVGGTSSENIDYFDSVIDPAPYVIAFVLLLTFVLLTVVFRSVVVAGTAVALNLLSVGAAYGLLVLVFQEGVGADLLGFQQTDTIEAWVPLFLFSVLFGLSMDYQVFLLSRIRERYDETGDTTDAVTFGVGSTARIITGCRAHHRRGVLGLRARRPGDVPADGLRGRGGVADRRDDHPLRTPAERDEAPRRAQLVLPAVARMAPARAGRGVGAGQRPSARGPLQADQG